MHALDINEVLATFALFFTW